MNENELQINKKLLDKLETKIKQIQYAAANF